MRYFFMVGVDGRITECMQSEDLEESVPQGYVEGDAAIDNDLWNSAYVDSAWTIIPRPLPPPEPPDRITQLEDESAALALELAITKSALEQAQDEQAQLLLTLAANGVI